MYTKDKRTVALNIGAQYRRVSDGRIFKLVGFTPGGLPKLQEDNVPLQHAMTAEHLQLHYRPM